MSDYTKVPEQLKALKRWCVWRYKSTGKPDPKRPGKMKFTKPPFQALRPEYGCDCTNPDHYSSFDEATLCAADPANKMHGIGFILGDGFAGFDADCNFDLKLGMPSAAALDMLKDLPTTYMEISPSGDGFHALWFSDALGTAKQADFEFYTDDRYFTVTGRALGSIPMSRLSQEHADSLITRINAVKPVKAEVSAKAPKADRKLQLLFEGKWQEAGYPSQSDADLWLCGHLFRKHKDAGIVDQVFRATKMFRPKWDEKHGDKTYGQMTIEKALATTKGPLDSTDTILLNDELHRYVAEAEQVLVQKEELQYFSRGGDLVKPVLTVDADAVKGLARDGWSVIIQSVSNLGVLRDLSANTKFVTETKEAYRYVAPPETLANHLIDRVNSGETSYRRLKTVTQAPCLLPSGVVLQKPGYAESVLLMMRHEHFPEVPAEPTKEQAIVALKNFDQLFHKFCFVRDDREAWNKTSSYAATLAAVLSLIARPSIPTVPLFGVTAVVRGSGKTKLVEAVCQAVIGWNPTRVAYRDEQELEKLLTPLLKGGDRACLIDNISHNLKGDALCGILTSTEFQARILGKSEKLRLLNNTVFFATGNNLTIEGDLARRALLIRLDPGVEQPETLHFDFEPVARARELYSELVAAALTALRAYIVVGKPWGLKRAKLGSFEEWDSLVCGCLDWLGYADPVATTKHVSHFDPERETGLELLRTWHEEYGSDQVLLSKIRKDAGETYQLLKSREEWNPRVVAFRLRRMEGRIIGGYKLHRSERSNEDRVYLMVVRLDGKKPVQPATQTKFDDEVQR